MTRICLAGDGWGAISAFKSLQRDYPTLYVATSDEELTRQLRDQDFRVRSFEEQQFDVIVCAGYKPIVPSHVLKKNTVLNIHYSLLPKYRGMHSVVWAILNGEDNLGLTIHEMNEFIDDGDIVYQHSFNYRGHTATEVMEYCNDHVEKCLSSVIGKYLKNEIIPRKQDKGLASWVCKRNLADCQLDFSWTIEHLHRYFKALSHPYPRPFFYYKNHKLSIEKMKLVENNTVMTQGRVVNIDNEGVWIQVSGGYLVASIIMDENEKIFDSREIKIGCRL
ncbi:TPA: hypothetical protein RQJ91_002914 [Vibrio vulnificus]|nr:hypothetical protein [Vibrio vulnificus]